MLVSSCFSYRQRWGLNSFVSCEIAVYSSREVGKLQCFYWIRERVQGLPVRFCVVGDGIDECEAAQWLAWPFVKINIGPDADNRLPIMSMEILEQNMRTIYKLDQ